LYFAAASAHWRLATFSAIASDVALVIARRSSRAESPIALSTAASVSADFLPTTTTCAPRAWS
jgi:hypothetical protein